MSPNSVLIVGAGPTGLVLALHLSHHGIPFRLIDKNPGPGLASRAMVVHARTLELYAQLGLADEIIAQGIKGNRLHLKEDGRDVATLNFTDFGAGLSPYPFILCYPQDDHERFLVSKLAERGVNIEWNTTLKSFSQTDAHVRAVIEKSGDETLFEVEYLCGCDGARSAVRQGLELDFPGGTYSQIFYVADVKVSGGGNDDIYANLGETGLGLILPVRSTGMKRFIGTVPEELQGKATLGFSDIQPYIEKLLHVHAEEVNWFSTYHVHHRVAEHFRMGRAFLAGDAGHIHSPAGGQGMNTGIGDAINLSWKLAHVLQGRAAPTLLDTYESERLAFAKVLVASTDTAFTGLVGRGWGGRLMRTVFMPTLAPLMTRFTRVRRMLFNTISQIRIQYRHSSLSSGQSKSATCAGDRLPWIAALDNFAPLRSRDWQLHIYGAVEPELAQTATNCGLALHAFPWNTDASAAGLHPSTAYLIRPDGYIGLVLPEQNSRQLADYIGVNHLKF
ncbi:MAG TPA: FAD-dependent monooxygenase [Rhodocyclaceae bacterium]|nr:FAD-dependent monooxygenase [Rhodocyclaceae bacterium]